MSTNLIPVRKQLSRTLSLCLTCLLALSPLFGASESKVVDLSILEDANQYIPRMTREERIQYMDLNEQLDSIQSSIRSGQFLMNRKPSALNPNENVSQINAKGKQMVESGKVAIMETQKALATLLETVRDREELARVAASQFAFEITESTWEKALKDASEAVIEACWNAKYKNLLYNRIYLSSGNQSFQADITRSNDLYDILTEKDGRRFSVKLAQDLSFASDTESGEVRLTFPGEGLYTDQATALLLFELIPLSAESQSGYLNIKAVDWNTHQIVASKLIFLTELTFTETEIESLASLSLSSKKHLSIQMEDTKTILRVFENLETPYLFECASKGTGINLSKLLLLKEMLIQKTNLNFVADTQLNRIFVPREQQGEFKRTANASFTLESEDGTAFQLSAEAKGSGRSIPVGPVSFLEESSTPATN